MINFLTSIGFNPFDFALIILCPVGAILGSFAQAILVSIDPNNPPNKEGVEYIASQKLQKARGAWIGLRLILGGILGLVIGLYFIGSIQENGSTISKIFALSILAGYAAPKIWLKQNKYFTDDLESSESENKNA